MVFTKKEIERAVNKDLKIWVVGTEMEDFDKEQSCPFSRNKFNIFDYPEVYKPFVTTDKYEGQENINEYSKILNEYVAMYYVWKNNLKSKYVAFCHYRRLIPITFIDFNDLDKGKIQYFSCHSNREFHSHYFKKDALNHKYSRFYEFVKTILSGVNVLYDDIEGYLNEQQIHTEKDILEYNDCKTFILTKYMISREIYACRWEEFDKLMRFMNGYVQYVFKKHNISSLQDMISFYKTNVIDYLKNNFDDTKIISAYGFLDKEKDYPKLLKSDGGYSEKPTMMCWRYYAFILEELMAMHIALVPNSNNNIIENNNFQKEEHLIYYKILKYLRKNKQDELLSLSCYFEHIKLLNFYQSTADYDINIDFLYSTMFKENKHVISNLSPDNDKYILNFFNTNLIHSADDLNKKYKLLFLEDEFFTIIYNDELQEKIINSFENKVTLISIQNKSLDLIKTHEYDNFLNLLKSKGFNIKISQSVFTTKVLYFIELNKGET